MSLPEVTQETLDQYLRELAIDARHLNPLIHKNAYYTMQKENPILADYLWKLAFKSPYGEKLPNIGKKAMKIRIEKLNSGLNVYLLLKRELAEEK